MSFNWTKFEVHALEAQTLINKVLWTADEVTDANNQTLVTVTKDMEALADIVKDMQQMLNAASEGML